MDLCNWNWFHSPARQLRTIFPQIKKSQAEDKEEQFFQSTSSSTTVWKFHSLVLAHLGHIDSKDTTKQSEQSFNRPIITKDFPLIIITFINLLRSSRYFPFHSAHLHYRNLGNNKYEGDRSMPSQTCYGLKEWGTL